MIYPDNFGIDKLNINCKWYFIMTIVIIVTIKEEKEAECGYRYVNM